MEQPAAKVPLGAHLGLSRDCRRGILPCLPPIMEGLIGFLGVDGKEKNPSWVNFPFLGGLVIVLRGN